MGPYSLFGLYVMLVHIMETRNLKVNSKTFGKVLVNRIFFLLGVSNKDSE